MLIEVAIHVGRPVWWWTIELENEVVKMGPIYICVRAHGLKKSLTMTEKEAIYQRYKSPTHNLDIFMQDPFVKIYLLQKGKKISKKKTSVKKGDSNPVFNEAMIFSVPAGALQFVQTREMPNSPSQMIQRYARLETNVGNGQVKGG
ncbi:hypothetical protein TNCV_4213321 [Trichonephila clavipes]|nr:hypothetical protein TNCV_4213321 [Trichonephila clavipes]